MFGSTTKTETPAPAAPAQPTLPRTDRSTDVPERNRAGGVLSSGVSIKGDVSFRTELVIDGQVDGAIKSEGKLTIGQHARIRGEIRAGTVTVQGTVEGNVFASDRCSLESGATLRGDIEAPRLAVDENATFMGSAKISTKPQQK